MSKKFLDAIVEFRSTSEVEAYDKIVSKWLKEAKEGGFAEQLLDEMIFYAEKAEIEVAKIKEKAKTEEDAEDYYKRNYGSVFLK